jgi:hypothetical protein
MMGCALDRAEGHCGPGGDIANLAGHVPIIRIRQPEVDIGFFKRYF